MLEVLNRTLMLLCGSAAGEGAEIAAPAGLRVQLARVEAVLAGGELSNHDGLRRPAKTIAAIGIVVRMPTATRAHPMPLRRSGSSLSATNSPSPAPSTPRVPASRASSGKLSSVLIIFASYTSLSNL